MMFSQRLGFMHQLLFAYVLCVCGCMESAEGWQGSCFLVISLPCSHPVFIFQIFLVLHQPWSATTREAVSPACWARYKNTANDEPCTKSFQPLANLFTNARLLMGSGWLGKMCFSAKDANKTWSFDLQPEWTRVVSTGYFLAKVTNLQWQKLWLSCFVKFQICLPVNKKKNKPNKKPKKTGHVGIFNYLFYSIHCELKGKVVVHSY